MTTESALTALLLLLLLLMNLIKVALTQLLLQDHLTMSPCRVT